MSEETVQYETARTLPDPPQSLALMPAMTISQAVERYQAMAQFVKELLVEDVDFGQIPGTDKPTLLKPGAEKLTTFFGLVPSFDRLDQVEDWTGAEHGGEPFFYFRYSCVLYSGDRHVGEGIGSCNSWEKKYRYRTAQRTCPDCGEATVLKSKFDDSWFCWEKRGGCGAKWPSGTPAIEDQKLGQILNENPADLVNTIDKMAQKRALVAATLITVNASAFFTQDMDDMVVSGDAEPEPDNDKPKAEAEKPKPEPQTEKPKSRPSAKKARKPRAKAEAKPEAAQSANELDAMEWDEFYPMVTEQWNISPRQARDILDEATGTTTWGQDMTKTEVLAILEQHQEMGNE